MMEELIKEVAGKQKTWASLKVKRGVFEGGPHQLCHLLLRHWGRQRPEVSMGAGTVASPMALAKAALGESTKLLPRGSGPTARGSRGSWGNTSGEEQGQAGGDGKSQDRFPPWAGTG